MTTATRKPRGAPEVVLVVDDMGMLRHLAARILREAGYEVLEASNGGEALTLGEQRPDRIDILVTDVVMPVMGGRELANRLREKRPGLKVVFVSGYTGHEIVREGILEPGVAFLQKPYSPESLAGTVRAVLDGREGNAGG